MSAPDSPVLDWQDGQPRSRRFGDVYFSRAGGLDETRHVFLLGNDLPARWATLRPGERFVVGEVGFGTGLNFLCTWQEFARHAPPDAQLHFVSCELEPLSVDELREALALWPGLRPQADALLEQYRAPAPGWHHFAFRDRRMHLTLLVGDARQTLARLQARVDAWFFDGFSPAKNPQPWGEDVFALAARRSAPGATLATYSVAGSVRRAAARAGFDVWKAPGYGTKRQMLRGRLRASHGLHAHLSAEGYAGVRSATVIGAGLAGCAAAASLARRGWAVRLVDRRERVAAGASGNAQGMLYARLTATTAALGELVLAGYQHTLRQLRALLRCDGESWSDAPLLQLAFDDHERRRQTSVAALGLPAALVRTVTQAEAAAIAGIALPHGGLCFAQGGWAHPPALCAALAAPAGVEPITSCAVAGVRATPDGWEIAAADRRMEEPGIVVIATADEARALPMTAHLPLRVNRGQITLMPASANSAGLRAVICGEHYVAPARCGLHTTGATFAREDGSDVRLADNVENVQKLAALAPAIHAAIGIDAGDADRLTGRAGLRCASSDYLPLVGELTDGQGRSVTGAYVSLAHGSRGLLTAPLAGEILAACIEGEPAPLPADLMAAMSPSRFVP